MPDAVSTGPAIGTNAFVRESDLSCASVSVSTSQLAVLALLATIGMLFAGFASAYLVRREGTDFIHEQLPGILGFNTVILAASSAAMEGSRAALRRRLPPKVTLWVAVSAVLGLMFLAGQFVVWRQLVTRGVYLPSSPYSSFFYVLTGLHGLHLFGGILALAYLLWRFWRPASNPVDMDTLGSCVTYWHFMGGIWLFVYLLLLY